jgi:hypothetical protein
MTHGIEHLAERFAARAIPKKEWTHEEYLAMGLWHVARFGALGNLPDGTSLDEGVDLLLRTELSRRDFLFRFYERETLMSARARTGWVEPDRSPLRLPT